VVAEALAEGGHVVVAALARVVRRVEADAQGDARIVGRTVAPAGVDLEVGGGACQTPQTAQ